MRSASPSLTTTLSLRLTHQRDANASLQHPRIAARDRRRLLAIASEGRRLWSLSGAPSLVSERLSGDILSHGYFSAEVTVGTPPQRFSLIVDTGSSITAVPCAECMPSQRRSNPGLSALVG